MYIRYQLMKVDFIIYDTLIFTIIKMYLQKYSLLILKCILFVHKIIILIRHTYYM